MDNTKDRPMEKPEDVQASCASPCSTAMECSENPVKQGVYDWGDRARTTVRLLSNGSAEISQGDSRITVECFGFFRDVIRVFDRAIEAMPESELQMTLLYRSMGTSRNLPVCDWG
jgi:hypothetical protein